MPTHLWTTIYVPVTVHQAPGILDGGDVLQIGSTLLVGMSHRTNRAGLEQLAAAVQPSGVQVLGLPLDVGLHLKSAVTALDDETLLASDDAAGRAVVERLRAHAELAGRFRVEWVPDALAANVLRTGRHVVMQVREADGLGRCRSSQGPKLVPVTSLVHLWKLTCYSRP